MEGPTCLQIRLERSRVLFDVFGITISQSLKNLRYHRVCGHGIENMLKRTYTPLVNAASLTIPPGISIEEVDPKNWTAR